MKFPYVFYLRESKFIDINIKPMVDTGTLDIYKDLCYDIPVNTDIKGGGQND